MQAGPVARGRHEKVGTFMRKLLCLTAVSLGLCTGSVHAQGFYPGGAYTPGNRPAYSPYLNLLRRDNPLGAAGNYYGLVRPEINFRNSIGQLETQQTTTSTQQNILE